MSESLLYDPIRKQQVADEPEERVRQALIRRMVDQLGYPPSLLAVERALSQIPNLAHHPDLPDRRIDLLVFRKEADGQLHPLILIECKAVPLTQKAIQQVSGYNQYVQAPYFAICNQTEFRMGWQNGEELIHFLPPFDQL